MKKNSDKYFMNQALRAARRGMVKGQTPFGACIVKNGRVIISAHNVVWKTTDISAHAEITAIRLACKKLQTIDLSGCIIYSTCEPCPMCFAACHWARLEQIIYGASIQDAQKAGFNELKISNPMMKRLGKSPVKISGGFMRLENKNLFKKWSRNKLRQTY